MCPQQSVDTTNTDGAAAVTPGSNESTVNIELLRTGSVSIDRALAYEEVTNHPMPETGWFRPAEKREWVPVSAYLLEHPTGVVLVDTGWHRDVRTDERGHLGRLLGSMHETNLPAGEAVDEQLAARDLAPEELVAVVITHLHPDHVSGLDHVREAPRVLVSEPELAAAGGRFSLARVLSGHMWAGVDLEPFGFEETGVGPRGRSHDLFGDGSVHLVWVPGHADGQVAVLARTDEGVVLLASDAAYGAPSLEDGRPPGAVTDRTAAVESLAWVREVADSDECVAVVANHDPAVVPGFVGRTSWADSGPSANGGRLPDGEQL
ncbi:N-acyl homoserine lactonase family protein [Halorubrum halophilum]|uniref:N-acyl homoserine lactonase family protein n=1 Tax=Halorubrum halophilum TaxID=413816 RepID=UPI001D005D7E|nr:N-acyl homoserine lactonase family protein [Halorubrum halophilum]